MIQQSREREEVLNVGAKISLMIRAQCNSGYGSPALLPAPAWQLNLKLLHARDFNVDSYSSTPQRLETTRRKEEARLWEKSVCLGRNEWLRDMNRYLPFLAARSLALSPISLASSAIANLNHENVLQ